MSSFYKDLKDLRIESGIDLEEIHNRTKISLEALRAIESGQFDELPQTYIRLFVRAYANEIGADENSTLSELDKFLSKESKVGSQLESNKTYQQINKVAEKKDVDQINPSLATSKNIRTDMVKGIALLSILIFSIYIIRQINKEEASKAPIAYTSDFEEEGPITNQILQNDFDLLTESVQIMEEQAPYTFKMATVERVWYKTKIDTLTFFEDVLPSGDNRLYEFSDSLIVLFKYSKGLNLYLNGSSINSFKSSSNPLRIIFSSFDKTVTTQQFIPKN
tara:strand:- start:2 stop:832 length:831 start_codon:yes stop_codon:yes gene_type:complete